jgi:RNA polymerase sigma factor (sigma-70 family)
MAATPMNRVIQHVRRAALLSDSAEIGDGELLGCFIETRDAAAFASLVKRHGPMVWGVCRRHLNHHDAEDAFQATFLVLVRKATSIRPRQMVGNWLFGVAHQTALHARRTTARRAAREVQVMIMPEAKTVQQDQWHDAQTLLDQELSRLPDMYRVVIVLCDLEGRTRREAALQLGVPEGTVAGRLARARALLAKRLSKCGFALSAGTLATVLAQQTASASVPASVVDSTVVAAGLMAAGKAAAPAAVSGKVAALTEGVLKTMLMSKLKGALAVVLVLSLIVTGATILVGRTASALGGQPPVADGPASLPKKNDKEKEKEAFTAWGKEVGGLQAGLGYKAGEKRAYGHGETVNLVVRVRNVGKEDVKFRYLKEFFEEKPPTVTGGEGKTIRHGGVDLFWVHIPVDVNLAPGKEMELHDLKLKLGPASAGGDVTDVSPEALHGKGKFQIQYEQLAAAGIDPNLTKLATGKLELEVKEAEKREKEAFTVWGKKVGGLQAGLGFRPGEKRAYHHGEKVTLVLRVRNPADESDGIPQAVEFKHIWAFFVENPPTITDADGKAVELLKLAAQGRQLPRSTTVVPGKEVDLYEWEFDLRPKGVGSKKEWATIHGVGKFSLQCERIVGPTSANPNHPNPTLDKLATGKLELEIKADPPPPTEKETPQKQDKEEAFTAWGKEVDGLQAGLGFRPGEKRAYSHGETVKLVVRARNIGKKEVKFQYLRQFLMGISPAVTDGDGKPVPFDCAVTVLTRNPKPQSAILAPGKEIEIYELEIKFRPASESDNNGHCTLYGTGKFRFQYERLDGPDVGDNNVKPDPTLSKLGTGKLELEVKEPEKKPQTEKKEPFTVWGKEVGGLQAGLGYPAGAKHTYAPGETVKLIVRVRNVGKDEAKFRYSKETFFETPPSVTDGEGKSVTLKRRTASGFAAHLDVTLAPGKELDLAEVKLEPRMLYQSIHEGQWNLLTTGKFSVWYDRLEDAANDKALSKLATGKLELEIKSDPPPPTEKETPQKQDKEEAFTEWGKEVGGLQAGVRLERIEVFNAAANRWEATPTPVGKIHQGSDIIFKVFVRNLGKQEVKLKFIEPSCWLCSEDGRNLKFDPCFSGSRNRFWSEKTLQPGEKWEVGQLNTTTRQPKPTESFGGLRLLELGKFRVSCPTALMQEKGDKLATGEVEIEIVSPKSEK